MSIRNWLQDEQPRQKLLTKGANALSDAELLAILLRIGCKGKSAVALARELLRNFGGLTGIFTSSQQQLNNQPGIGPAKYSQFRAALELAQRYLRDSLQNINIMDSPEAAKSYLTSCLKSQQQEVFACLFLNNHHHLLRYEELFYGTINNSTIYPREVVKKALSYNAAAIVLAHNHPSGCCEPSEADINLTKQLRKILSLVDVRVVDHIIIGHGKSYSFAEHGI